MQINFFSFFMSIFWSNILILGIYIGRKKVFFIQKINIMYILLLYMFPIFRAVVPIDFISSKGVLLGEHFSGFYKGVYIEKFPFIGFSLFQSFLLIWGVGFILLLCSFIYKYFLVIKEMLTYETATSSPFMIALDKVEKVTNTKVDIDILLSNRISTPLGVGVIRKKILLPKQDYTEGELYYIVLHEYTHFLNHDLLIKMLIQFYCYLFWWNPFVYLLKTDLAQTLEINCDLSVTANMNISQKTEYLDCIVSLLKRNADLKFEAYYGSVTLLSKKSNLVERFTVISNSIKTPPRSKLRCVCFLIFYMFIVVISYTFVFQPQYNPPSSEYDNENTFEITSKNSYIHFGNGQYFLVNNDNKITISKEAALQMESQGFKIQKGD